MHSQSATQCVAEIFSIPGTERLFSITRSDRGHREECQQTGTRGVFTADRWSDRVGMLGFDA